MKRFLAGVLAVWLTCAPALAVAADKTPLANYGGGAIPLKSGDTVPVSNGGTGATSLTAHCVVVGQGTSAAHLVCPSSAGQVLTDNGAGSDPSFAAAPGCTLANPTATASDTAVNGSATTCMRSDGAPAIQKATSSQFGLMKPDGTTISCTAGVCGASAWTSAPQGRLTLVSGTMVMESDQTAKSTIYYDCYRGNLVPYYTGSADAVDQIAGCEVSLTMQSSGTGVTNSGGVFDIWWVHSGANRICVATNGSGGGWASDTGGTNSLRGSGYSASRYVRGYWTNSSTIAHCYNGTTDYGSISADQATLLGTVYTTAAGQTGVQFTPAAASGGSNAVVGLSNAYNLVPFTTVSRDSTNSWTYNSTTQRPANNSTSNRVTWVDSLGNSSHLGTYQAVVGTGADPATLGVDCDSTSASPSSVAFVKGGGDLQTASARATCVPLVGMHYAQAMEALQTGTTTSTYYGNAGLAAFQLQSLTVTGSY